MQRPIVTRVCGFTSFAALALLTVASIRAETYYDTVMDKNPVGYWRLDETNGATAANKVSSGVAGVYNNFSSSDFGQTGALTASGDKDAAVGFSGSGEHVSISESVFTPNSALSIEFWFNSKNITPRQDLLTYTAYNESGKDIHNFGLMVSINGSNSQKLSLYSNGTGGIHAGTTTLANDTWYHVVMTRDASGTATLYLNGNTETTVSGLESFGEFGCDLWVGCWHGFEDSMGMTLNGSMDELAIYGTALTESEVKAHYAAGITSVPEPTSVIMLNSALIGLLAYVWRKRR